MIDDAQVKTVGDTIRARILAVNNVAYTSQAAWQLYYASGGASDWFKSKGGISYSFTVFSASICVNFEFDFRRFRVLTIKFLRLNPFNCRTKKYV
jgi:hypothetical protein